MIPFIDLQKQASRISEGLSDDFQTIMRSCQFIGGPYVERCEAALGAFVDCQALTVSSGTDALLLALMTLNLQAGEAVLLPAFTFAASAEVVALLGAIPVFVDVDERYYNVTVASLHAGLQVARQQGLKVRGAVVVDLFGQPADHQAIAAWAEEQGLWIVDDAAQAFGAMYKGCSVMQSGQISTTSFFPAKPLGCYGDGGAVFCQDEERLAVMHSLREHGQGKDKYTYDRIGINGRFDAMQAAVILAKLRLFPEEVLRRQQVADRYNEQLKDLKVPELMPECTSVYAQYTLQVPRRDAVCASMAEAGVPTGVYYPKPIAEQKAYARYPRADLANTQRLCESVMSLPMHPYLTEEVQDQVVTALREAL